MGTALRVVEIFASLQGEGYWTGTPMTFVRLAGCNAPELGLDCVRWCDTRASWDPEAGREMEAVAIVAEVRLPRLCLTGGEPLLQIEGVRELVSCAHQRGVRVHLETNGTVDPAVGGASAGLAPGAGRSAGGAPADMGRAEGGPADDGPLFDWAVVSPKPPGYLIASGWTGQVDELKLVADERLEAATAERLASAHPGAIVSIQPEYGLGARSVNWAVELVMSHPEWRLSLQMHKFLGIR
jgi:7-carboxy-7-deazaguanine synthase